MNIIHERSEQARIFADRELCRGRPNALWTRLATLVVNSAQLADQLPS